MASTGGTVRGSGSSARSPRSLTMRAGVPTAVLLTDTQAVVVQAEARQLCGEGGSPFPLCADPKGTLSAIAQRLLR